MLDENLPTYRFKTSSENPLNNILYFTHNGSDPTLYNFELSDSLHGLNQIATSKSDVFRSFKSELVKEISAVLPEDWGKYKKLQEDL